jgi:curved DNA-binding protein CbpA
MGADLYRILGLDPTASAEAIREAHRRLVRTLHPDVNPSPDARAKFEAVQRAYETLSDPQQRRAYDRASRGEVPSGAGHAGAGHYAWENIAGPRQSERGRTRAGAGARRPDAGGFDELYDAFFAKQAERDQPEAGAPERGTEAASTDEHAGGGANGRGAGAGRRGRAGKSKAGPGGQKG